jgi:hypothetical protein
MTFPWYFPANNQVDYLHGIIIDHLASCKEVREEPITNTVLLDQLEVLEYKLREGLMESMKEGAVQCQP